MAGVVEDGVEGDGEPGPNHQTPRPTATASAPRAAQAGLRERAGFAEFAERSARAGRGFAGDAPAAGVIADAVRLDFGGRFMAADGSPTVGVGVGVGAGGAGAPAQRQHLVGGDAGKMLGSTVG